MGEFNKTIGPLLLGTFLHTYIYGMVMLQYASHLNTRIRDSWWMKSLGHLLFAINTYHCSALLYMAWFYGVTNYVNPDAIAENFWVIAVTPICIAITGLAAHSFLSYRLFRLTRNAIASYIFLAVSVVVFALSLGVGIVVIRQNLTLNQMILHQSSSTFQSIVWAWLVTQVVLEAGLTGTVGFSLKTCKPQFMPPSENSTLVRVIRGSIQSGTLVFVFSFANLIAAGAGRTTTVFLMFSLPIAPLYSLIIFDTLLARRVSLASPEINSMPGNDPSGIWIPTIPKAGISGSGQNQPISLRSIQVRTEVYTDGRHIESTAQFDSGSDDAEADQKVGNVV